MSTHDIKDAFRSTNLQSLTIGSHYNVDLACDLVLANPNITYLNWASPSAVPDSTPPPSSSPPPPPPPPPSSLFPNIPSSNFSPPYRLRTVLINNSPHLERLDFQFVQGFTSIEEWVVLPKLHTLLLDCLWTRTPALHHLVRFCPALRHLIVHADSTCDVNTMTPLLRDFCPKLESICCADGYMLFQSGLLLKDDDYVTLIQDCKPPPSRYSPDADEIPTGQGDQSNHNTATQVIPVNSNTKNVVSGLKEFKMGIPSLYDSITNALLTHSNNLETLELYICGEEQINFTNANRLLALCPNLKYFAMFHYLMDWNVSDAMFLFQTPWACHKLNTFVIDGIQATNIHESERDEAFNDLDQNGEEGGWGPPPHDWGEQDEENSTIIELIVEIEPELPSVDIPDQNDAIATNNQKEIDQQASEDEVDEEFEDEGSDLDSLDLSCQTFLPKNWKIHPPSNDYFRDYVIDGPEKIAFAKELFRFAKTIPALNKIGINYQFFDKIDDQ
ncbi:hypothetical protein BGZ76_009806 [Entomortierella beljakovae]|nr:hypothetical protein BGZ76_009806 [Entomortierella beljakovae]